MTLRQLTIGFCALILSAALGAQWLGGRAKVAATLPKLALQLPSALPGWTVREVPVADSPEVQRAAESILRYDDVVFREYQKDGWALQVYVSAWQPGKMDARDLAVHNPDNCWTANGFTRLDEASRPLEQLAGVTAKGGQFRRFVTRNSRLEVAYWLMVDGRPFGEIDESTRAHALATRATAFFRTVWFGLMSGGKRAPIYFVRLSAPQELEQRLADPELKSLLASIRTFLAAPPVAE